MRKKLINWKPYADSLNRIDKSIALIFFVKLPIEILSTPVSATWRTFFKVLLPLSVPGWVAGATLVFASATTAFISQSVIGGGRLVYLPSVIWQQAMVISNWPFAAVASIMLLVSVLTGIVALNAIGRVIHPAGR